jgi:hypothetical protein
MNEDDKQQEQTASATLEVQAGWIAESGCASRVVQLGVLAQPGMSLLLSTTCSSLNILLYAFFYSYYHLLLLDLSSMT